MERATLTTTIHTNSGALVAQATLRNITISLDKVSKQIQTGYKGRRRQGRRVDVFGGAGPARNVSSLGAVQQSLSGAVGLAEVGRRRHGGVQPVLRYQVEADLVGGQLDHGDAAHDL